MPLSVNVFDWQNKPICQITINASLMKIDAYQKNLKYVKNQIVQIFLFLPFAP